MKVGKHTCEVLKSIRKQIADLNGIAYTPSECTFSGECTGTCPNCERERQYLERELSSKLKAGKALKIVGIAAGLSAMVACQEAKGEEPAVENTVTQQRFQWDSYRVLMGVIGNYPSEIDAQLNEMVDFISEFPNETFLLVGHTDSRGDDRFNLRLSYKKAEYLRGTLIGRGVPPDRILSIGCGPKEPIIPNAQSEEEHEQNRRVTLEFYTPERMEEIVNKTRTIDLKKK